MYRFKRITAVVLTLCMVMSFFVTASAASDVPTEAQAYSRMIALKQTYPEGMRWTNANYAPFKGGIYSGGYGCAGFAFILSDAAFGDLPARIIRPVSLDKVHTGEILRINNDSHSVIILEVKSDSVVIAEGNFNSSIHWGRTLSATEVAGADYVMTRYPEGTFSQKPAPAPAPELSEKSYYYGDVDQNGTIEVSDALRILKHLVHLELIRQNDTVAYTLANADQKDGISVEDAIYVLKVLVKLKTPGIYVSNS